MHLYDVVQMSRRLIVARFALTCNIVGDMRRDEAYDKRKIHLTGYVGTINGSLLRAKRQQMEAALLMEECQEEYDARWTRDGM